MGKPAGSGLGGACMSRDPKVREIVECCGGLVFAGYSAPQVRWSLGGWISGSSAIVQEDFFLLFSDETFVFVVVPD